MIFDVVPLHPSPCWVSARKGADADRKGLRPCVLKKREAPTESGQGRVRIAKEAGVIVRTALLRVEGRDLKK